MAGRWNIVIADDGIIGWRMQTLFAQCADNGHRSRIIVGKNAVRRSIRIEILPDRGKACREREIVDFNLGQRCGFGLTVRQALKALPAEFNFVMLGIANKKKTLSFLLNQAAPGKNPTIKIVAAHGTVGGVLRDRAPHNEGRFLFGKRFQKGFARAEAEKNKTIRSLRT